MRKHKSVWQRGAFVLGSFLSVCASGAGGQTLKETAKFDLPGPGGKRFDYLTIDPDDHYLISAHLGADQTYVIDLATNKVVATIADTPGAEGVEYVPEHHRAFLSCEGNELMTVFDLDKKSAIAFLPLPGGPDVIKFDPGLRRIYVACYSGAIAVFHQDGADHYRKLEDFRVQHAVHTVAVDLKTHKLYTPEQEEDRKPVARMVVYEALGDR